MISSAQAGSDQLEKALGLTVANMQSLELGYARGAANNAEAARIHVEIAARDARGSFATQLNTCQSWLRDVERQSLAGDSGRAMTVARQAEAKLQHFSNPESSCCGDRSMKQGAKVLARKTGARRFFSTHKHQTGGARVGC